MYSERIPDGLPKTTLAAILIEQKKPLIVSEIELPKALEIGQVLVEFSFSGICGSQIGEIDGAKGPDKWLPHLLGHEATGKVLAVGLGVKFVRPGDMVVAHWRPSQGIEASTPKYTWQGAVVNAGWVTTFNRFGVISENRLTRIPPSSDSKTAALYGCAITTGFGAIDRVAKVLLGETIVIFGAGGIGLNLVQGAALAGASEIVAVDRFDHRLALAKACGATQTLNASQSDVWMWLSKYFEESGPDIFVDNTGNSKIIANGYRLINPHGRVVLVGVPRENDNISLYTLPLHFGKKIVGTAGGEALPHRDIPRYMSLVSTRKIDLHSLVTDVAPLRSINTLISKMRNGESSGRCLIDFSNE